MFEEIKEAFEAAYTKGVRWVMWNEFNELDGIEAQIYWEDGGSPDLEAALREVPCDGPVVAMQQSNQTGHAIWVKPDLASR